MLLIATTFIMLVLLVLQVPSLYIYQKWRELIVFFFFWAAATTYALLVVSALEIPSPSQLIIRGMGFLERLVMGG
ncbi:MAG: hypothetical protein D5R97_10120 [Candidatus Syntrophonatronum acetioxidans]|uniref:Uncharacterized protein n=1 Tax=Candidatus Syntrophonatronum acetioxidans TaxID=1795816 RepID=A0A424Y9B6_9FIRM|nr:MAG: hypothetical protein D5R97_10120 [Candidatus Syntrophonatronum acetioxidans]